MARLSKKTLSGLPPLKVGAMFGGLISFIAFTMLHWRGIGLPPDGWAYWQGAVSIVEGHGYSYFSGTPISAWPPLYSLYLAFWTALLGPTGFSLVIANGFLITCQGVLWSYVLVKIIRGSEVRVTYITSATIGVYIGLFISIHQQQSLATSLQYTLLPVFLLEIWRLCKSGHSEDSLTRVGSASILGTGLVLSHNASFAFVGAGALLVLLRSSDYKKNLVSSFLLGAIPAMCWLAVRLYLNQTGSHAIGIGAGKFSYGTYLFQLITGVGGTVVPRQLGANYVASILLFLFLTYSYFIVYDFLPNFVLGSLFLNYVMFNVTFVRNPIGSIRYVMFIPIITLPIIFLGVYEKNRYAFIFSVCALFLPLLYWTYSWTGHYLSAERSKLIESKYGIHNAIVSPEYPEGPPKHTAEGILLSPKQWEEPKTGDGILR